MQGRLLQDRHVLRVGVQAKCPADAWADMTACRACRLVRRRSCTCRQGPTAAGALRTPGRGLHPPRRARMGSGALAQAHLCAPQGLHKPWGLEDASVVRA